MSAITTAARRSVAAPLVLLAAFSGAVLVRVSIAGPAGASSLTAALLFAALLATGAWLARAGARITVRGAAAGVMGGAVLVVPVLLAHGLGTTPPAGNYLRWAGATAVVAGAEEAYLRGALYDAVRHAHGVDAAIIVGAVAFAALHVPLYGWHAAPLDLAVGLILGGLRATTGTWTAPAIAHIGADLVGWWLL